MMYLGIVGSVIIAQVEGVDAAKYGNLAAVAFLNNPSPARRDRGRASVTSRAWHDPIEENVY